MVMRRRKLLKYGLFGTGLLATAAVGLGTRGTKEREPRTELHCFSVQEFSILVAIAECIIPGDTFFPPASALNVAEGIDSFLSTTEPYVQADFKALLLLIENALSNGLLEGMPQTFTNSSPEEQTMLLRSWQHSSIDIRRTAYKALNGICQATYFGNPESHALLGYDGPPPHLLQLIQRAGAQ